MEEDPHTLGFLLGRAAATMATLLNHTLKNEGIDLPHSQFVILRYLYYEDGISQQELAEKIFKDNAAIKRTLDHLEQKNSYNAFTSPNVKTTFSLLKKVNSLCPRYYKVRKKPCNTF
ncbi:MAG: MarR family transcriptional regulator [Bacteroides sp.]|nr:MarR family transcriptional regulator [Bacteroides sp.]